MKSRRYCYHVTNGISRSALNCGTITAGNMEDAARRIEKRLKITREIVEHKNSDCEVDWITYRHVRDGKKVIIYITAHPEYL